MQISEGQYEKGGLATQVKLPRKFDFKSLKDSLRGEDALISDFGKFERPAQIQLCLHALSDFKRARGGLSPRPWSDEDAADFVLMAKEAARRVWGAAEAPEVDEKLVATFAKVCSGNLSPVAASFGGLVAQEVLKVSRVELVECSSHLVIFKCAAEEGLLEINFIKCFHCIPTVELVLF